MNIMLFLKNLQGRGVSKVYINLAKALKSKGYTPFIVIRENVVEFDTKGLEIFVFDKNTAEKTDRFIKEKNINFIISNNVTYLQNIKNISQDKIFYTVHMLWGERIFKNLRLKKLFDLKKEYKNKNVIAVSEAVKEDLLKKIKIKPKRIEVIHDIFDFEEIEKKSEEFEVNNEYILNIGAFSKEKNHELLLKTYAKLDTNLKLYLIGKGKLEEKIKKLAKDLKIENKVKFLGFQKNPYPYIKNAKLTLLTSTNEALPGVAIESLYLNTPVVSTDSKGIRDILKGDLKKFIADKNLILLIEEALVNYPKIEKNFLIKNFGFEVIKQYERLFNETV